MDAFKEFLSNWAPIFSIAGPIISLVILTTTVVTFLLNRWQSARNMRTQEQLVIQQGRQQIEATHVQGRQQIEAMHVEFERQDKLKQQSFKDVEQAERQLVCDYTTDFIARMDDIAILQIDNLVTAPQSIQDKYGRAKSYLAGKVVDKVHFERNWGLWYTFLIFQILAAYNMISSSRWTRPVSDGQKIFMRLFDDRFIPALASNNYPGSRILFRDQIDVVAEEMIVKSKESGVLRPLHWVEFTSKYAADPAFGELCELAAAKIRIVTDETKLVEPDRKDAQARLCMLTLYAMHILRQSGIPTSESIFAKEEAIWRELLWCCRRHASATGVTPAWYVFEPGDIQARSAR